MGYFHPFTDYLLGVFIPLLFGYGAFIPLAFSYDIEQILLL